jgi:hypothetical protein
MNAAIRSIILRKKQNYMLQKYATAQVPAAYSLRRLKSDATKAIRIKDDTTDETDIGFVGEDIDTASISAWLNRNLVSDIPLGVDGNDDGVSDGWGFYSNGTSSCFILNQEQELRITASTSNIELTELYKSISCLAGNIITFSATGRVSNNVRLRLQIDYYNYNTYLASTVSSFFTNTSNATISITGTAPATATSFVVLLLVYPVENGDTGSAWFKDASVTISNQSAYIAKWYDQSGNGNDASQSTVANMPRIVNAGVLDTDANNKPKIQFSGNQWLSGGDILDLRTNSLTMHIVAKYDNTSNGAICGKSRYGNDSGRYSLFRDSNLTAIYDANLQSIEAKTSTNDTSTATRQITYLLDRTNGNLKLNINRNNMQTTSITPDAESDRNTTNVFAIGAYQDSSGGMNPPLAGYLLNGAISEIIMLNFADSSEKAESSQMKYFAL